jgi:hypothetical protein
VICVATVDGATPTAASIVCPEAASVSMGFTSPLDEPFPVDESIASAP